MKRAKWLLVATLLAGCGDGAGYGPPCHLVLLDGAEQQVCYDVAAIDAGQDGG